MNHPKNMHRADLAYWIREGMIDCFAIDFLSDRAQNSLVNFLAAELERFYKSLADVNQMRRDHDWSHYRKWEKQYTPFFEKAVLRHPLGALFGETMAKAVDAAVRPIFDDLEKGKRPEGSI